VQSALMFHFIVDTFVLCIIAEVASYV